jgi:hypothetical protein
VPTSFPCYLVLIMIDDLYHTMSVYSAIIGSLGIAVAGTQILGCAGGFAARTPQNLEFFTANP